MLKFSAHSWMRVVPPLISLQSNRGKNYPLPSGQSEPVPVQFECLCVTWASFWTAGSDSICLGWPRDPALFFSWASPEVHVLVLGTTLWGAGSKLVYLLPVQMTQKHSSSLKVCLNRIPIPAPPHWSWFLPEKLCGRKLIHLSTIS